MNIHIHINPDANAKLWKHNKQGKRNNNNNNKSNSKIQQQQRKQISKNALEIYRFCFEPKRIDEDNCEWASDPNINKKQPKHRNKSHIYESRINKSHVYYKYVEGVAGTIFRNICRIYSSILSDWGGSKAISTNMKTKRGHGIQFMCFYVIFN